MSVSEKTISCVTVWGKRLVLGCLIFSVMKYLLHFQFPWSMVTVIILAALEFSAGACLLIVGLGGPKPRVWESSLGCIFTGFGCVDLYILFR